MKKFIVKYWYLEKPHSKSKTWEREETGHTKKSVRLHVKKKLKMNYFDAGIISIEEVENE